MHVPIVKEDFKIPIWSEEFPFEELGSAVCWPVPCSVPAAAQSPGAAGTFRLSFCSKNCSKSNPTYLDSLTEGLLLFRNCCQGRTLVLLLKLNGNMRSSKGKLRRPKYQGFLLLAKYLLCLLSLWGNLFSWMSQMSARFYTQGLYFRWCIL